MAPPDLTAPPGAAAPAVLAAPVNSGGGPGIDAGTNKRFYTISASLRESYDSNVNTTDKNEITAFKTSFTPSVLIDLPISNGSLIARYTFDLTYYAIMDDPGNNQNQGGGGSSNNSVPTVETTHEFNAQYTQALSERFNVTLSELFRYYIDPSLDQNTGTAFRNGPYISNTIDGSVNAQWTPLFSTTTSYTNLILNYEDSQIGQVQDYVENTGTQIFTFAILPKISASVGGIIDDAAYKQQIRGYTNYTGFFGVQWQALPSISVTGRGGLSYLMTESDQNGLSPYVAISLNWSLGKRSNLSFNYSHEITPSNQSTAQAQESDRFGGTFTYDITPHLSAHLSLSIERGDVTDYALTSQSQFTGQLTPVSSQETYYYVDSGLTYRFDKYFDVSTGVTETGNESEDAFRKYNRTEIYVGVRGTY